MKIIITTTLCSLLIPSVGWARKVEDWPYERLFDEADLVVIGTVQANEVFDETWQEKLFERDRFAGVNTNFRVKSVFKGEASDSIDLVHFKFKSGATLYEDGPSLMVFFV